MRLVWRSDLLRTLPDYLDAALTYEAVGATRADLPTGYRHTRRRVRLGAGSATFDRAATALLTWEMHRRSGLEVATEGTAEPDRTVILGVGVVLALVLPCRVVYVVNEQHRRGFAYGTLPDHLEQGEEAFLVVQDDNGTVWLEIAAFSRPGSVITRCAGPVGRALQSLATTRYQRALATTVAG